MPSHVIETRLLLALGTTYRAVLEQSLGGHQASKRKGVGDLAAVLKVHPTFVSKVLLGKADFSPEQATAWTTWAGLSDEQAEIFCDLVSRDRAGDHATRQHYERRLHRHREAAKDLRRRLGCQLDLSAEIQERYYGSWVPQAAHILLHTPGVHDARSIGARLKLAPDAATEVVAILLSSGLAVEGREGLQPTSAFVHISNESPYRRRMHLNWRQKAAGDLLGASKLEGLHFSSAVAIDADTVRCVRELLSEALVAVKTEVVASRSEDLYALGVDFYRLP